MPSKDSWVWPMIAVAVGPTALPAQTIDQTNYGRSSTDCSRSFRGSWVAGAGWLLRDPCHLGFVVGLIDYFQALANRLRRLLAVASVIAVGLTGVTTAAIPARGSTGSVCAVVLSVYRAGAATDGRACPPEQI